MVERKQRNGYPAAQWAKTELTDQKFSDKDKSSAILKLQEAAFKYDSQGSVNIAFYAKYLQPYFVKCSKGCLICIR